ncbi:MAG: chemotaxis protein CheW [Candidatus Methanoperedenaceae archaeon]|nr:chemotaxis protein CheW [Candidatus Methanoperedenaceae archaeon]
MIDLHTNLMKKTDTPGELQLVIFNIGSEEFGIEIKKVQEIIRMPNITEIPRAPSFVKGVINLRGRIIVVISLNVILGIGCREYNANTRIIVVDIDSTVMGFIVESVSEVLHISSKDVELPSPLITSKIQSEYIEGVGKLDDRLLILLNIDKMLNAEELKKIHSISPESEE